MDDIENRREEGDNEAAADLYDQGIGALDNEPAPLIEDTDEDEDDDLLLADDEPATGAPAWIGALTSAALGLVVVQALILLGVLAQALADERFEGDFFHKFGFAGLTNLGIANGLMLLVATVLAGLPALLGAGASEAYRRRAALAFWSVAVLAVLLIVGTPLAVRARVHILDLQQQSVDPFTRRTLATYVAGTLGTALVALGATLGLARLNRTSVSVSPPP